MRRVLVDTSVWVAHFRSAVPGVRALVELDQLITHPLVVLELACGIPPAPRARTLGSLRLLQLAQVATFDETLSLIETHRLFDSGCGAMDVALLASVLLTPGACLWTLDKPLQSLAAQFGVAYNAKVH
jgi:predicted nucleic acid-binding protein